MAAAAAAAAAVALVAPAHAADPGRWTETGRSTVPLYYYQGVAADPARRLFFNGIYTGLYRTDPQLNETARNDDVFPLDVYAREQYNHIGDIDWDAREGGRILLPTECYYPQAAPGQDDPNTLAWRYYVKLDPAEIPKVMWVAVSPNGKLVWTQSHDDLLAYRTDQVSLANAAPGHPPIKAVRRLKGAKPPSGITGAAFYGGRLYVAGGDDPDKFQVWSIDLTTGARRLEIEKPGVVGESEGLAVFSGLGGVLHWLIQPYNTHGVPSYGFANGTLLHFNPKGRPPTTSPARPAKIRLTVRPSEVPSGKRVQLRFHATARVAGRDGPVDGARVRIDGLTATTGRNGYATISFRSTRTGKHTAVASRPGLRPGTATVTVTKPSGDDG